jgi:hypothetical protein
MMHIVACCNNGFNEVHENYEEWALTEQPFMFPKENTKMVLTILGREQGRLQDPSNTESSKNQV